MMKSANDRIGEASTDATDDGYILGEVIDNEDPLGLSRTKVSIPNMFAPNKDEIPWIGQHRLSPFGTGEGYGWYGSPAIGSKVRVKFQDQNAHYGMHEADEYNVANANPKFKDPKTWGFKDPGGTELFINYETGDWQFTHSSGVKISYDADGNRITIIPGDSTETISGDSEQTIEGDATQTISGALTINVTGDASISTDGNLSLTAGGNIDIDAGGTVNITGSTVNLN